MKPFFDTPQRWTALQMEAQSWIDTPFMAHGHVKGGGVDCIWLAAELYKAAGHLKDFAPPDYTLDEGKHAKTSKVLEWLNNSPHFAKAQCPSEIGDLLCLRIEGQPFHMGVQVTNIKFIHAIEQYGVIFSRLDDASWARRITAVYQPVEVV